MPLRLLPDHIVNRIAAGEVVERPASVVKELVENSVDAGATQVAVTVNQAGRNLIRIEDDGKGMTKDELELCLLRHATSKLDDDDLWNVRFLGFRGEALASVASISRISVASKTEQATESWEIRSEGGKATEILPSARRRRGTCIEIRDLFYATPARLKFLKHDRTEINHIHETLLRQALAHPDVSFSLHGDKDKEIFSLDVQGETAQERLFHRVTHATEPSFKDNCVAVSAMGEGGYKVAGYAGLPTLHRSNSHHLYLFVNGRPVRDKVVMAAVRAAYQDYLPRMRYPIVALYVEVPTEDVDVNVHPGKTEVRFRHESRVRGAIARALHAGLREAGHRSSTEIAAKTLHNIRPESPPPYRPRPQSGAISFSAQAPEKQEALREPAASPYRAPAPVAPPPPSHTPPPAAKSAPHYSASPASYAPPSGGGRLGAARCQLHENYIIAQTDDSIVIIDQHAAHERLRYEKMKRQYYAGEIKTQQLLIPEIVELAPTDAETVAPHYEALKRFGFHAAPFGENAAIIRATPAILGNMDAAGALKAIIDDIRSYGADLSLKETIEEVMATMACKGAVKSGRRLTPEEMDGLLREMEATPYSGQCNHGRPTYVELKLKDVERLFGRT